MNSLYSCLGFDELRAVADHVRVSSSRANMTIREWGPRLERWRRVYGATVADFSAAFPYLAFLRFWCENRFTPPLWRKPRDFRPLNMSPIHISDLPMHWLRVPGDFRSPPYPRLKP